MFFSFTAQQPLYAQAGTDGFSAASVAEIRQFIANFGVVSPVLLRGAQPRPEGLECLKRAGVKTIINLRDGRQDIEEERENAERLGLNYVSIPMSVFGTASQAQVDRFLSVLKDPACRPAFVHCRQGQDRCGTMVAIYRVLEQSWTARQAYAEMLKYGFHPFFVGLSQSVFARDKTICARRLSLSARRLAGAGSSEVSIRSERGLLIYAGCYRLKASGELMGQIVERQALAELAEKLRSQKKTVVSTNGCFDILHVGHVRILQEARSLGDLLIVGLNSDDSVARLKGPTRPVNNQADRAEVLCALSSVDYVTIFSEDTPVEFLRLLKPTIHVKGADYTPDKLEETPVVEANGGRLVILKLVPGKSTTSTISRIRAE